MPGQKIFNRSWNLNLDVRLFDPNGFHDATRALLSLFPVMRYRHAVSITVLNRVRPTLPSARHSRRGCLGRSSSSSSSDSGAFPELEVVAAEKRLVVRVAGVLSAVVGVAARVGLAVDDADGWAARAAVSERCEGGEADADDAGGDFG